MAFDDLSLDDRVRGPVGITVSVKPHGDDEVVVVIDDVDWDEERQAWKPWCFVTHHGMAIDKFDLKDYPEEQLKGLGITVLGRLISRLEQLRKRDGNA